MVKGLPPAPAKEAAAGPSGDKGGPPKKKAKKRRKGQLTTLTNSNSRRRSPLRHVSNRAAPNRQLRTVRAGPCARCCCPNSCPRRPRLRRGVRVTRHACSPSALARGARTGARAAGVHRRPALRLGPRARSTLSRPRGRPRASPRPVPATGVSHGRRPTLRARRPSRPPRSRSVDRPRRPAPPGPPSSSRPRPLLGRAAPPPAGRAEPRHPAVRLPARRARRPPPR